ncbi:MAG: hypothetical protein M1812_002508 [Candelaria pacifica]|nr:MAG: hypothetical protein M1812_002508 [Candelaria pacifica]
MARCAQENPKQWGSVASRLSTPLKAGFNSQHLVSQIATIRNPTSSVRETLNAYQKHRAISLRSGRAK